MSREWFPCFANYRRDGYDYEGLYEDGKMTSRCRRIMDILELLVAFLQAYVFTMLSSVFIGLSRQAPEKE